MSYKCRICGMNDVDHFDDICESCAEEQNSYVSMMQSENGYSVSGQEPFQSKFVTDPANTNIPGKGKNRRVLLKSNLSTDGTELYGNTIVSQDEGPVRAWQSKQGTFVPSVSNRSSASTGMEGRNNSGSIGGDDISSKNKPLASGITKNISIDIQRKSALRKLFRTLFRGVPYTLDNDITMFQVFPDYTGTLNAMGNACDQVIVYGKLNAGAIAENNDVEVYGNRDSYNNIVAKKIVNKSSGTIVTADGAISAAVIWTITIILFVVLMCFLLHFSILR